MCSHSFLNVYSYNFLTRRNYRPKERMATTMPTTIKNLKQIEKQIEWDNENENANIPKSLVRALINELKTVKKANKKLKKTVSFYHANYGDEIVDNARRDYKDQLFRFIFSKPEWALQLYNALCMTDYNDPSQIVFTTIGNYLYLGMRNDVSFTIGTDMMIWEHQSTFNANMPVRFLPYAGSLFSKYLGNADSKFYGTKLQAIPIPLCYCFYNGEMDKPDMEVLRLSDAYNMSIERIAKNGMVRNFRGKELLEGMTASIEVAVIMVNINHDKNRDFLKACKPLEEYSWLVAEVRRNRATYGDLTFSINRALDAMPEDFVIWSFLMEHRMEVFSMLYEDFNAQVVWQGGFEGGMDKGLEKGMKMGADNKELAIVSNLIRRGHDSAEEISDITDMPVDEVKRLAEELGVALPRW